MIRAYRLEYKGVERPPMYYRTLAALAADNPRDIIGVSLAWLHRIDFDQGAYEGKRCRVLRIEILNTADVVSRRGYSQNVKNGL